MVYVITFLETTVSGCCFFKVYKTILIVNILSKKEEGGKRRNQGNKELTEQQRTKIFPVRLKRQMAEGWGRRKRLFVVCLLGSDPHIWTSAVIYLGAFIRICMHVYVQYLIHRACEHKHSWKHVRRVIIKKNKNKELCLSFLKVDIIMI